MPKCGESKEPTRTQPAPRSERNTAALRPLARYSVPSRWDCPSKQPVKMSLFLELDKIELRGVLFYTLQVFDPPILSPSTLAAMENHERRKGWTAPYSVNPSWQRKATNPGRPGGGGSLHLAHSHVGDVECQGSLPPDWRLSRVRTETRISRRVQPFGDSSSIRSGHNQKQRYQHSLPSVSIDPVTGTGRGPTCISPHRQGTSLAVPVKTPATSSTVVETFEDA